MSYPGGNDEVIDEGQGRPWVSDRLSRADADKDFDVNLSISGRDVRLENEQ
jgi:hypothetical protein